MDINDDEKFWHQPFASSSNSVPVPYTKATAELTAARLPQAAKDRARRALQGDEEWIPQFRPEDLVSTIETERASARQQRQSKKAERKLQKEKEKREKLGKKVKVLITRLEARRLAVEKAKTSQTKTRHQEKFDKTQEELNVAREELYQLGEAVIAAADGGSGSSSSPTSDDVTQIKQED